MNRPPLIGITAYPRVVEIVPAPTLLQTANRYYIDSVVNAGGCPIILPVVDPRFASAALDAIDGLVLPGGGDVDPACYGVEPAPETNTVDPDRDAWELACVRAALERNLPILATCRGAQVLNVALGGTLVQDVPTATGERHGWASRFAEAVHTVQLDPRSRLAAALGATEIGTNSLHHQAVDRPGRGVSAVGWSHDGTIEAIEVEGHPEIVAVQWHPELMQHDPVQRGLFESLLHRAGMGRATY